jgi:cell division protein FtsB
MDVKRGLRTVLILAAAVFAFQGGEYSTVDLLRQRAYTRRLAAEMDVLQHQVDSLTALVRAIGSDPAMQERIAREEFGMLRGNELLYRFAPAHRDSGGSRRP